MRLPVKLSLLLAATTCFPLLLATAFTLPRGREALRSQLDEIYLQDARALAAEVHRTLVDKLDALSLATSTLRLSELDPEARDAALLLIYKETRGADIVGLFDASADAVGNIIRFPRLQGALASEHEPVDDDALAMYAHKVPLQGAFQAGLAIGPVYVLPDALGAPVPRVVLAVAIPGPEKARWVVAVEVSLRRVAESFARFRPGESGAAFLVDGEGRVIVHPDRDFMMKQTSLRDHPLVRGVQSDEWLGANAPVPLLGWKAVVQESADEALRPLRHLARDARFEEAAALIKTRDGMNMLVTTRGSRSKEEAQRLVPGAAHVVKALNTQQPALNDGGQMMALPLIQRGAAIGVVCLETQRPYSDAEVRLALSLTQPAAMAVENARLFDEVQRLATLDGLTGTYNRRHFMELAHLAFESARRFGQPLTAVMLDVDHFKSINDEYGHHVGDQVLRTLAERCRSTLRTIDVLGRYGGEEFAILLPGTTRRNAATILAERIRHRVAEELIHTDAGPVGVTVSVGVAAMETTTRNPEELFKRADAALYEAKQAGRNRVVEDAAA